MRTREFQEPIDILLVEDNDSDALLVAVALSKAKVPNRLHRVSDGQAALEFLHQQGRYVNAPRPQLILLDLNLPKRSGSEVLAEIKEDEYLKTIPVVVLTSSRSPEDILQVYSHYANCYINKPVGGEDFSVVVQSIEDFWFSVVTLPPSEYSVHERKEGV